jgi:hypothetical protein
MNILDFKRAVLSSTGITLDSPPIVGINDSDGTGYSVSLNSIGDICAVGEPFFGPNNVGRVVVYKYNTANKLWEHFTTFNGSSASQQFGYSVSINHKGDRVVIGSKPLDTVNGNIDVYSYSISTSTWSLLATITGEGIGYWSGFSVATNSIGNIIAFGSPKDDANGEDKGSVVICKETLGTWQKIGTIYGELIGDNSGWSIALNSSGTRIAIGAPFNNTPTGIESGHTKIYDYSGTGTTWTQVGLDLDGSVNSQSGFSVSLNSLGDIVAIGNILDDTYANNGGVTKIFKYESGAWQQLGSDIFNSVGDLSGYSVSLNDNGDSIAIGAPFKDSGSKIDIGAVQIYKYRNNNWYKIYPKIVGKEAYENSGWSVSLSKNFKKIAIGSPNYTKDSVKSGIVRIYSLPVPFKFWKFDYSQTSALTGFSVTTSDSSNITIKWGDSTTDTTASSNALSSHTYNV